MVPPVNGRAGLPGRRPTAVEEAGGRRPVRLYVAIGAIGAGVGTTALRVPTSGVSYESGRVIGCDGLRVPAPGESFW